MEKLDTISSYLISTVSSPSFICELLPRAFEVQDDQQVQQLSPSSSPLAIVKDRKSVRES